MLPSKRHRVLENVARTVHKVSVSPEFRKAMNELKRMKGGSRRAALVRANDKFVRDLSHVLGKVRNNPPDLSKVNPRLLRRLRLQRKRFQTFVNKKTSIKKKRRIITQKGGIFPALIPIICAAIGAAGTVGGAAAGAAIAK